MPRKSSLPERLRYLQPFRKKFASKPPEELDEDSGMAPLLALFSKRIGGLSQAEADKLMDEDVALLKNWLSLPEQETDPLQFALGVFLITSPVDLVKHIREEAAKPPEPRLCLHMDLPPGAKLRKVPGGDESGMLASWQGQLFTINAFSKEVVEKLHEAHKRTFSNAKTEASKVRFGEVAGTKIVSTWEKDDSPLARAGKEVHYALTVPGGHVTAEVSVYEKKPGQLLWDEAKLEAYFHTLRVSLNAPLAAKLES